MAWLLKTRKCMTPRSLNSLSTENLAGELDADFGSLGLQLLELGMNCSPFFLSKILGLAALSEIRFVLRKAA